MYGEPDTTNLMKNADVSQSYMLFRACLIYAHTSMFPYQLAEFALKFDVSEIMRCGSFSSPSFMKFLRFPPTQNKYSVLMRSLLTWL